MSIPPYRSKINIINNLNFSLTMWLTNSSIGRKVIMSVTGLALILFLTFHGCMNVVALFSREGYNWVCEMLGANWYAVAATAGLGVLVLLHFVYAIILTLQNQKARGNSKYAVTDRPAKVEWASQNMLLVELLHTQGAAAVYATDGYYWIEQTFSCPVYSVLYLVWLCALWFHLNHGFWSAFQTLGASGKIWLSRLQCIGLVYSTIVIAMFAAVVIKFQFAALFCGQACGAACAN